MFLFFSLSFFVYFSLLWALLRGGGLETLWVRLGVLWGYFGELLGRPWVLRGPFGELLGRSGGALGSVLGCFGGVSGRLLGTFSRSEDASEAKYIKI